jgi:hypothetical protein
MGQVGSGGNGETLPNYRAFMENRANVFSGRIIFLSLNLTVKS